MANAWFRLYAEFATDPKVQMLSEIDQRRYIMLLCLRCSNVTVTLHDEEVAFQLRISNEDWIKTKETLITKGLIDEDSKPCAWDKRQYASDSSTERVSKHREKMKRRCNVTVTPPDTDTDTDTDTEKKKEKNNKKETPPKFSVENLILDGVSEQAAQEFWDLRKSKKAVLTSIAWDGFKREAIKIDWSMDQVVRECLARGWQGFKADWVLKDMQSARASPQKQQRESLSEKNYSEGLRDDGTIEF